MISITTAANTKIGTITVITTAPISLYIINHVALYMIRKTANHKTTPKKNKKNLKLNLELLIEISLTNLITNSINNLINILWTIRIIILT
jgi:hypothetical protein